MSEADGSEAEAWYRDPRVKGGMFVLLLLLLLGGWGLYLFSDCDCDSDSAGASSITTAPTIVHDGGDTDGDGQVPALDGSIASARARWAESAGRPYLLQADWNTEGLFGIYCTFGVAGDRTANIDAAPALADTGSDECVPFADSFVDASGVEELLDSAESVLASGGTVDFNEFGVPSFISDGGDNQIRLVRFTFDPQE